MHLSQGGRKFVLVILLLAVCYGADWTEDNCSYWVGARSRAFQTANGPVRNVSGGSLDNFSAAMSDAASKLNATESDGSPQLNDSALMSVFGQPLNGGLDGSDASSSSDTSGANSRLRGAAGLSSAQTVGSSGSAASGFGMSMGQTD